MPKHNEYNSASHAVCQRLSNMKVRVKYQCERPFYHDVYEMTLLDQEETQDDEDVKLQVAHTTYHSCDREVLSGINTQYIQLVNEDIAPYNVQQALLSTISNDSCHIFNIISNAESIHRRSNISVSAMLLHYRRVSKQLHDTHDLVSSTTELLCNISDYNRVTVRIGNDCDTYCTQAALTCANSTTRPEILYMEDICFNVSHGVHIRSLNSAETQLCLPSYEAPQQDSSMFIATITLPLVTGAALLCTHVLYGKTRFAEFIRSLCRQKQ